MPLSSTTASTVLAVVVLAGHRGDVDRARQVVDHAVEDALDALVLEGRAGDDAEELERDGRLADGEHQLVRPSISLPSRYLSARSSSKSDDGLDQLVAVHLGLVAACPPGSRSSIGVRPSGSLVVVEEVGDHLHQVDHAREARPPRRSAGRGRARCALSFARMSSIDAVEVGADAVHLVDERDAAARCTCWPGARRSRTGAGRRRRRQNTAIAPSSTRSERSTSAVKSTWPGVSMMLMRCLIPFQGPAWRRSRRRRWPRR